MSDSAINSIIALAVPKINKEINGIVREEDVDYIDDVRENKIDGSNKTFYTRKSFIWFLGDYNNDGSVTTGDVLVYEYTTDDVKSQLTVSAVDETGKITLATAPAATSDVTMTYAYAPVSEYTPDPLLKIACAQLVTAMAFSKINATDWSRISLGKLTVARPRMDRPFYEYKQQYDETLHLLKSRIQQRRNYDKSGMMDVITERLK